MSILDGLTERWQAAVTHPIGKWVIIGVLVAVPAGLLGNSVYKLVRGPNVNVSEQHQREESQRAIKSVEESLALQSLAKARAQTQALRAETPQQRSAKASAR
jgi:hypothetical protein